MHPSTAKKVKKKNKKPGPFLLLHKWERPARLLLPHLKWIGIVVVTFIIVGILFIYRHSINNTFWEITKKSGFVINQVYLEGRKDMPLQLFSEKVLIKRGESIFEHKPKDLQHSLEDISWVESANVRRSIPTGTIHIRIKERKPVAVWQYQQKLFIIDVHGVVMYKKPDIFNLKVPLIVGKDAPLHVREILVFLKKFHELQANIEAFVRIGQRRWNLKLKNNITAKLPEAGVSKALQRLMQALKKNSTSLSDVDIIDVRNPTKTFLIFKKEAVTAKNNTNVKSKLSQKEKFKKA